MKDQNWGEHWDFTTLCNADAMLPHVRASAAGGTHLWHRAAPAQEWYCDGWEGGSMRGKAMQHNQHSQGLAQSWRSIREEQRQQNWGEDVHLAQMFSVTSSYHCSLSSLPIDFTNPVLGFKKLTSGNVSNTTAFAWLLEGAHKATGITGNHQRPPQLGTQSHGQMPLPTITQPSWKVRGKLRPHQPCGTDPKRAVYVTLNTHPSRDGSCGARRLHQQPPQRSWGTLQPGQGSQTPPFC